MTKSATLFTFAKLAIVSLNTGYKADNFTDTQSNQHLQAGFLTYAEAQRGHLVRRRHSPHR